MIDVMTWANAHRHGDALASQARLRHRMFVECRNIGHAEFEGMEYDRFDTPAAVYLLWRDADGEVRAMTRLLRTTEPYMLQTCWPFLVADGDPPAAPEVWEGTRLCVDAGLERGARRRALSELLCGVTEYLSSRGATHLLAVTSRLVAMRLFRQGIEWLGEDHMVEGRMESAFRLPVRLIEPAGARAEYGFGVSVLRPAHEPERRQVA